MKRIGSWVLAVGLAGVLGLGGCTPKAEVEVKPIRIEPIYITMDINIRIDRQLDRFFEFQDDAAPVSQPATRPAGAARPTGT